MPPCGVVSDWDCRFRISVSVSGRFDVSVMDLLVTIWFERV